MQCQEKSWAEDPTKPCHKPWVISTYGPCLAWSLCDLLYSVIKLLCWAEFLSKERKERMGKKQKVKGRQCRDTSNWKVQSRRMDPESPWLARTLNMTTWKKKVSLSCCSEKSQIFMELHMNYHRIWFLPHQWREWGYLIQFISQAVNTKCFAYVNHHSLGKCLKYQFRDEGNEACGCWVIR